MSEKEWQYVSEFLHKGTKNPYIANLVVSISKKTRKKGELGPREAIDAIKKDGIKEVISLFGHVNSADVWSGGTIRGMHHVGSYTELQNIGLRTNIHVGSSAGGIPAAFRALDMRRDHKLVSAIDTSASSFNSFAMKILESVEAPILKRWTGKAVDALKRISRFIKLEGIIPSDRLEQLLSETFKKSDGTPLLMEDVPSLHLVVTHLNSPKEHKLVINSHSQPKEKVGGALRKSAGHVYLFRPINEDGKIYVDGIVEGFPLMTAMDAGADIAIGFLVNYGLTNESLERINVQKVIEKVVVKWPLKIAQKIGITQIPRTLSYFGALIHTLSMQITSDHCRHLTGYNPDELLSKGDPYGKVLLVMPDISDIPSTEFTIQTSRELIARGRNDTLKAIRYFLNPAFEHERYDPTYFSRKLVKD